jgi:FtsP/CotA-like multicopper oxidase with cupredoxin domain
MVSPYLLSAGFASPNGSRRYHTHYSAQYSGGAVGPIVIYGPTNKNSDIDIGPVMLSDWYRDDYMTSIQGLLRPAAQGGPINPLTNSSLINGKMRFPCEKTSLECATADYSVFKFTSGKNHLLRLMNIGSNAVQKFSIDGHTMQVIANDFMPLQPYNTSMIALGVGQRADVLVYGSGKPTDKFWLRSNIVGCSVNDGLLTEALGTIYYEDADMKTLPTAAPNQGPAADPSPRSCGNDPLTLTVPTFPLKASTPVTTKNLDIRMKNNGTHLLLNFGDNSFRANFNDPLLARALVGLSGAYDKSRNVWNVGPAKTMRAIIQNYDNAPHPVSNPFGFRSFSVFSIMGLNIL